MNNEMNTRLEETSINHTLGRLEEVIQQVATRAATNQRDITVIDSTVSRLTELAQTTSATVSDAKTGIQSMAERLTVLAAHVEEVSAETHEIERVSSAAHQSSEGTREALAQIQEAMNGLDAHIKKILGISSIIENIAQTTNILSLNASIEAARAGEHGRGFSVLAAEVRKLADQTREQAQNITIDLRSVAKQLDVTRSMTDRVKESVDDLSQAVTQTHESFQAVGKVMADAANQVTETAELGQQQELHMVTVSQTLDTLSQDLSETSGQLSTLTTAVKETALSTEQGFEELSRHQYDGTVPLAYQRALHVVNEAESLIQKAVGSGRVSLPSLLQCGLYTPYGTVDQSELDAYFQIPPHVRTNPLNPMKYHVPYDHTVEPQLNALVQQSMAQDGDRWILLSVVDLNGYVVACADVDRPALTGDPALDDRNRFKRLLPHPSWVRGSRVGLPESVHWLPNNQKRADLIQKCGPLKKPKTPATPLIQTYIRNNVIVMTLLSAPLYIGEDQFGAVMVAWS